MNQEAIEHKMNDESINISNMICQMTSESKDKNNIEMISVPNMTSDSNNDSSHNIENVDFQEEKIKVENEDRELIYDSQSQTPALEPPSVCATTTPSEHPSSDNPDTIDEQSTSIVKLKTKTEIDQRESEINIESKEENKDDGDDVVKNEVKEIEESDMNEVEENAQIEIHGDSMRPEEQVDLKVSVKHEDTIAKIENNIAEQFNSDVDILKEEQKEKRLIEVQDEAEEAEEDDEQSDFEFSSLEASDSEESISSDKEKKEEEEDGEVLDGFDDDDEYDEETGIKSVSSKFGMRTVNESDKLPEVQPISINIPSDMPIVQVGTIQSIVDDMVIIESNGSGDNKVLDSDSILVFENREILGRIFDTFGPVIKPLYSVRFNSSQEIDREKACKDRIVFCLPELCNYVFTQALKQQKGTDASNQFDEEPDEDELEFSDDEKETEHRAKLKAKKRGIDLEDGEIHLNKNLKKLKPLKPASKPREDGQGKVFVKSQFRTNKNFNTASNYPRPYGRGGYHQTQNQYNNNSGHNNNAMPPNMPYGGSQAQNAYNYNNINVHPQNNQYGGISSNYYSTNQPAPYASQVPVPQPPPPHGLSAPGYMNQNYYTHPSSYYPSWQQGYVPFTNHMMYRPMMNSNNGGSYPHPYQHHQQKPSFNRN